MCKLTMNAFGKHMYFIRLLFNVVTVKCDTTETRYYISKHTIRRSPPPSLISISAKWTAGPWLVLKKPLLWGSSCNNLQPPFVCLSAPHTRISWWALWLHVIAASCKQKYAYAWTSLLQLSFSETFPDLPPPSCFHHDACHGLVFYSFYLLHLCFCGCFLWVILVLWQHSPADTHSVLQHTRANMSTLHDSFEKAGELEICFCFRSNIHTAEVWVQSRVIRHPVLSTPFLIFVKCS